MTVKELIQILQTMPPETTVAAGMAWTCTTSMQTIYNKIMHPSKNLHSQAESLEP